MTIMHTLTYRISVIFYTIITVLIIITTTMVIIVIIKFPKTENTHLSVEFHQDVIAISAVTQEPAVRLHLQAAAATITPAPAHFPC